MAGHKKKKGHWFIMLDGRNIGMAAFDTMQSARFAAFKYVAESTIGQTTAESYKYAKRVTVMSSKGEIAQILKPIERRTGSWVWQGDLAKNWK